MPAGNEGIVDKAKEVAQRFGDTARGLFSQHSDKADAAIDKAGDVVDDKTGGKYTDKIEKAQAKAHGLVEKAAKKGDDGTAGPATGGPAGDA